MTPRKAKSDAKATESDAVQWTDKELRDVYQSGVGPGIIGREMWEAAQRFAEVTAAGVLGPALIYATPEEAEAHGARHLLPAQKPLPPAA